MKNKLDIQSIPLDCEKTWQLFAEGNTKGVFQLESQLGRHLSKKLKPNNMEHLAALISIMRPGVLEAFVDGKSMTDHYIDRKNGLEEVSYFHAALEPILSKTFGCLIYQEQSMRIAQELAGFNLQESDLLRKGIGHKKPEIVTECRTKFLDGCKKEKVVKEDEAVSIFEWIQKGQRYIFNKSHAVSYAYNAYMTAYCKAHYPKEFFTSYLYYAKEKPQKQKEISQLISNAKFMGHDIVGPDLRKKNRHFQLVNGHTYFGLTDIKHVGTSVFDKMLKELEGIETIVEKSLERWNWPEFLVLFSRRLNSKALSALIACGALDFFKVPRAVMEHDYQIYRKLGEREQLWIQNKLMMDNSLSFFELVEKLIQAPTGKHGGVYNKRRLITVESLYRSMKTPAYDIRDTPQSIGNAEEELLGIAITASLLDNTHARDTCKDIVKGKTGKLKVAAKIDEMREWRTKKDYQKMCFLHISDQTASTENVVVFPNVYREFNEYFEQENFLLFTGFKGEKGFIVQQVEWI